MKVIIAGSRTITELEAIYVAIGKSGFMISEVVSGRARGVDRLGEKWAEANHIPVKVFPADWLKFGKVAGFTRNVQMAEYVGTEGGLVAVWNGSSNGTRNMIRVAGELGLKVHVEIVNRRVLA